MLGKFKRLLIKNGEKDQDLKHLEKLTVDLMIIGINSIDRKEGLLIISDVVTDFTWTFTYSARSKIGAKIVGFFNSLEQKFANELRIF